MASFVDVAGIQAELSTVYGIDPASIRSNAALVAELSSSGQVSNALDIYTKALSDIPNRVLPDIESIVFDQVEADPGLRSNLIEANLEDANNYLQECLRFRAEIIDLGKAYLDTYLKIVEFWLLDEIHKLEVAAGVYNLPFDEALAELRGSEEALGHMQRQAEIYSSLTSAAGKGAYGAFLTNKRIIATANLEGDAAQIQEDDVGKADKLIAAYTKIGHRRMFLEQASWDYSGAGVRASISDTQGKVGRLRRRSTYTRKDIVFRASRAEVSRNLAWLQMREHARENSPVNYKERLEASRNCLNVCIRLLITRILALEGSTNSLYGIELPLITSKQGGILDDVSAWLLSLQSEITKFHQSHRVSAFAINLPVPQNGSGQVSHEVALADTAETVSVLRGYAVEYSGSLGQPISISLTLPPAASDAVGATSPSMLARVLPFDSGLELRPQSSEHVWNGSPYGKWQFSILDPFQPGDISAIRLYLWTVAKGAS